MIKQEIIVWHYNQISRHFYNLLRTFDLPDYVDEDITRLLFCTFEIACRRFYFIFIKENYE